MVTVGKKLTTELLHSLTFFLLTLHGITLQDTALYNTHSLSYIYCIWPNSMHAVPSEQKLSFSIHPKEKHGNSLIRKSILPSTEGNTSG